MEFVERRVLLSSVSPISFPFTPNPAPGFDDTTNNGTMSGYNPPDSCGAVGPTHIISWINGDYRATDRTTGARVAAADQISFWTNIAHVNIPVSDRPGLGDGRMLWDPSISRFVATEIDTTSNLLLIAASAPGDPSGAVAWQGIAVNIDTGAGKGYGDYDTLGVNSKGVYVALNAYSNPIVGGGDNNPLQQTIFAVPIADILWTSTTPISVTGMNVIAYTPPSGTDFNTSALQPAVDFSSSSTEIVADRRQLSGSGAQTAIETFTITWSNGVASFSNETLAGFGTLYSLPSPGIQPVYSGNPNQLLDPNSGGLSNVVVVNGSVWTVVPRTIHFNDGQAWDGAEWVQISASSRNTIQQFGSVADEGWSLLAFSIAVNSSSSVAIGMSGTSSNAGGYPCAMATGRLSGDPFGTLASVTQVKAGEAQFVSSGFVQPGGYARWGDFSVTQVDPNNSANFFSIQEYATTPETKDQNEDNYGTWWQEFSLSSQGANPPPVAGATGSGPFTTAGPVTVAPQPFPLAESFVTIPAQASSDRAAASLAPTNSVASRAAIPATAVRHVKGRSAPRLVAHLFKHRAGWEALLQTRMEDQPAT